MTIASIPFPRAAQRGGSNTSSRMPVSLKAAYVFMLVSFWVTFVGVFGRDAAMAGLILRWVGLAAFLAVSLTLLPFRTVGRSISKLVVAYLALSLLSSVLSSSWHLAVAKWMPMAAEVTLGTYILQKRLGDRDWQWLMDVLGIVMAVLVFTSSLGIRASSFSGSRLRGGLETNPNSVGIICLVALSIWGWRFVTRLRLRRISFDLIVSGIVAFLSLVNIVLTGSRSSAAGVIAMMGVGAFSQMRKQELRMRVVAVVILLGLIVWGTLGFVLPQYRVFTRGDPLQGGILSSRLSVWEMCLQDWRSSPWLGVGYGVASFAQDIEIGASATGSVVDGGGYAGLLASVGILGILPFAAILIACYYRTFKMAMARKFEPRHLYAYQACALMIGLSLNLAGEPWILAPGSPVQPVFWLAVGALFSWRPMPRLVRSTKRLPSKMLPDEAKTALHHQSPQPSHG